MRIFLVGLALIIATSIASRRTEAVGFFNRPNGSPAGPRFNAYLPQIYTTDLFDLDAPIWAHASAPAANEVALFRRVFTLAGSLDHVQFKIFADTRYEVWIDGKWLGRGPARFSTALHEYDIYQLPDLTPGSHLVAVLVQWAPNNRRSESVTPFLKCHLEGIRPDEQQFVLPSGPEWKASLSTAWQMDAEPVHVLGLIGPTELLDFRKLPPDWMMASFKDEEWLAAALKDTSHYDFHPLLVPQLDGQDISSVEAVKTFWPQSKIAQVDVPPIYLPRSISFPITVPITTSVIDAGVLSPGRVTAEITPGRPYSMSFNAVSPAIFTVEALSGTYSSPLDAIQLDGHLLAWQAANPLTRPDVYTASQVVSEGFHTLALSSLNEDGSTFSISKKDLLLPDVPFQQGLNAGRRLLLSEQITSQDVHVEQPDGKLNVEFTKLPAYLVIDLGRTISGRLQAVVTGPPGTVVDIGWDERLLQNTLRPLPFPGSLHPGWDQVDSWVLDGKARSLSTIDSRSGRYILIAVWGDGPVSLKHLQVYEERYPVNLLGGFSSSDGRLNQIWSTGVDTLYPNMNDAYTDTPWRERGQWWGDAFIADRTNRVAFGDLAVLRRGLALMSYGFRDGRAPGAAPNGNATNIMDYGMLWLHDLDEYNQLSEDHALLSQIYPVVSRFMEQLASYENPATGLLDFPQLSWSQTAYIETLGYRSRYGQSTALNAIYYQTLLKAADLAYRMGDTAASGAWIQKAQAVKLAANQILYIPAESRYTTNIYHGEVYPPTPQAQAWALAYDLVPENLTHEVAHSLLDLLSKEPSKPNVEIYGMYWVFEALGKSGHIPEALDIIRSHYGYLLDAGATTWWERFIANASATQSLSHSWGSSPTWFLSTYLLGASRMGPNTWQFKPALSGVSWASGKLPLQDGVLSVSWERVACQDSHMTAEASEGSPGEVIIPLLDSSLLLKLDGQVIWQDSAPLVPGVSAASDGIHISLPEGGSHNIEAHLHCYNIFSPLAVKGAGNGQ